VGKIASTRIASAQADFGFVLKSVAVARGGDDNDDVVDGRLRGHDEAGVIFGQQRSAPKA
jgi:hypothetical protein